MGLLRFAARSMLASYFVINGVKALKDPQQLVPDAEPLANAVVPTIKRFAPAEIAARIPEDAVTLVRVNGALQVFGGLALATGFGRRLGALSLAGSLIPSTIARHPFWSRSDKAEAAVDRAAFVKNVALLGGVLIASADTEGKPSLAWRAEAGRKQLAKSASRAAGSADAGVQRGRRAVRREAKQLARDARAVARSVSADAKLAAKDVQLKLA